MAQFAYVIFLQDFVVLNSAYVYRNLFIMYTYWVVGVCKPLCAAKEKALTYFISILLINILNCNG